MNITSVAAIFDTRVFDKWLDRVLEWQVLDSGKPTLRATPLRFSLLPFYINISDAFITRLWKWPPSVYVIASDGQNSL